MTLSEFINSNDVLAPTFKQAFTGKIPVDYVVWLEESVRLLEKENTDLRHKLTHNTSTLF